MRIYRPLQNIQQGKIFISDKEQLHYLLDVLRLKKGDTLDIFDGSKEYECLITEISVLSERGKNKHRNDLSSAMKRTMVEAKIIKLKPAKSHLGDLSITLACAIPKKAKIDYIIEKCTELGAARIIPIITERTIVRLKEDRADARHKRWLKIAQEASRQSGRVSLPFISPVQSFDMAACSIKDYDLGLIPNLLRGNKSIKEALCGFKGKSIIIFIGPEGDFSEREISLAEANRCISISLGDLVLKVDTAAIAIMSFLRLRT